MQRPHAPQRPIATVAIPADRTQPVRLPSVLLQRAPHDGLRLGERVLLESEVGDTMPAIVRQTASGALVAVTETPLDVEGEWLHVRKVPAPKAAA